MDAVAIFALIEKGLTVIGMLIETGQSAAPAIEALIRLAKGGQEGTLTDDEIAREEEVLDKLIADFNEPL